MSLEDIAGTRPALSVVIVTLNSERYLARCLETIVAHSDGLHGLEVIVVDVGSDDDATCELARRASFPVTVLEVPNHGFGYANNRGIAVSTGRAVLLLNADTEILDGSFATLLSRLEQDDDLGMLGVRQVDRSGNLEFSARRSPSALRTLCESLGSERWPFRRAWTGERFLDPKDYESEIECDWVSGSFMFARREAIVDGGLFDERFFIYCEEPDLCLRMRRARWRVRYVPSMTILHHGGGAGQWDPRLKAQEAFARKQYMQKHFGPGARAVGTFAFAVGFAIRSVVGSRRTDLGRKRLAASRAQLATLLGLTDPPFAREAPASARPGHGDHT